VSVTDGEKLWTYMSDWGAVEQDVSEEGGSQGSFVFSPARLCPAWSSSLLTKRNTQDDERFV
jgi:hypothetical protein